MSNTPTTNAHLSQEEFDAIWTRRCEMLNWAGITYRYHRKRQRFFDVMDKLTQAAAVGGGVAVAGSTLTDKLPLIGGVISFTGLLALVYGYSDKRQCHKELAEQAIQLAADIQGLPVRHVTEEQLGVWERVRGSIDLREPPNLKTLVSKCEWEQALAEGHKDHVVRPAWWQQAHMHFF